MARVDWLNLILFKIGWLVAVLGRDEWLLPQLAILAVALWLVRPLGLTLAALAAVVAVGIARDAALVAGGILDMGGPIMPVWLALLWLQFALVLQRGMHWLMKLSAPIQVVVGVVSGGLAYAAAVSLGAASLAEGSSSVMAWSVIALSWGGLLWLQLTLNIGAAKRGAVA